VNSVHLEKRFIAAKRENLRDLLFESFKLIKETLFKKPEWLLVTGKLGVEMAGELKHEKSSRFKKSAEFLEVLPRIARSDMLEHDRGIN